MSVRNVKIRFNLDKENDRRAYDYLQGAEKSYSKAVISAICGFMELSERTATEDAFLERVISTIREEVGKVILLADYYNLCRHPLHKHPLKKKTTLKPKKRYSLFLTAFKVTLIPAFDGTVMAISKGNAPTNTNGATILQY